MSTKLLKRIAVVLVIAVAVAAFVASEAQAAVVTVNPFRCQNQGGSLTVPAGSEITIRQGVSEQTRGIITAFLLAQTTTISLNGTTVDVSDAWPAPEMTGQQWGWVSWLVHPTGITLGAGDSLVIAFTTTLDHVVPEVHNPAAGGPPGEPAFNPTTSVTYTCTVMAV